LAVSNKNAYICTVKTIVRLKDVAETSGIFLCPNRRNINDRNRVGQRKRPQGIAQLYLTARSAVIFVYLSKTIVK
jgi:hypothetical protein